MFWLLLDLIQGAYDLARRGRLGDPRRVHRDRRLGGGDVGRRRRQAVAAAEVAGRDRDAADGHAGPWARLVPVCFVLGMFNFAYAVGLRYPA